MVTATGMTAVIVAEAEGADDADPFSLAWR